MKKPKSSQRLINSLLIVMSQNLRFYPIRIVFLHVVFKAILRAHWVLFTFCVDCMCAQIQRCGIQVVQTTRLHEDYVLQIIENVKVVI